MSDRFKEFEKKIAVEEINEKKKDPLVLVSETDAYIHERMKSQPQTLEQVEIKLKRELTEAQHALVLPSEFEDYKGKYAFRWINKKKRSIDHALDVIGWTFVNKVMFPGLPSHLFTANGSIERGDVILAFIPLNKANELRERPRAISRERVMNTPVQDLRKWKDRGEDYYKPDLGAAENDKEESRGITLQPDAENDRVED